MRHALRARGACWALLLGMTLLPAYASAQSGVAPLDETFGPLAMTTLTITNTIRDTRQHVSQDPQHAAKFYGTLRRAEQALQDWARKYPYDRWIPVRAFAMAQVFGRMHTRPAHDAAQRCRDLIARQFPDSVFAMQIRGLRTDLYGPRP